MFLFFLVYFLVVVSLRGIVRSVGTGINAREVEGGAATLRHALNQALQQNSELKSRLNRIHREASIDNSYASMNAMTLTMSGATSDTVKETIHVHKLMSQHITAYCIVLQRLPVADMRHAFDKLNLKYMRSSRSR